jgi:hypothetical protein
MAADGWAVAESASQIRRQGNWATAWSGGNDSYCVLSRYPCPVTILWCGCKLHDRAATSVMTKGAATCHHGRPRRTRQRRSRQIREDTA